MRSSLESVRCALHEKTGNNSARSPRNPSLSLVRFRLRLFGIIYSREAIARVIDRRQDDLSDRVGVPVAIPVLAVVLM